MDTLPRAETAQAKLSPAAYLLSSEMMDNLNSERLILTQDDLELLSLDPAPLPTDSTIDVYSKRTSQLLPHNRENLVVTIPVDDWKRRIQVIDD